MPRKNPAAIVLCGAVALALAVAPAILWAQAEHQHEDASTMKPKQVTMTGEVIDLYCFMAHPADGQGPDHAKCAKTCMEKGLPIGFLSNGEVYVITGKDHESVKDIVAPFAGMQSQLTGNLIEHHGVKALELVSIEGANAPVKTAPK